MKKKPVKRAYPAVYEKFIPIAIAFLVVLLGITLAVVLIVLL